MGLSLIDIRCTALHLRSLSLLQQLAKAWLRVDGRLGGAEGLGYDFLEAGQLHPAVHLRDHLVQAVVSQAGLCGRLLGHLEHRLVHHAVLHAVLIKLLHTGIAAIAFLFGHLINAGGHLDVAGGVIRVGDPAPLLLRRTLRRTLWCTLRRTLARVDQIGPVLDVAAVACFLQMSASIYIHKSVTKVERV